MFVRFRIPKKTVNIRDARLDDCEILSNLQWEYLQKYEFLDIPKSPEKYRTAIGSSVVRGDRYLVAEDDSEKVIGFVEQKKQSTKYVKIGYPYVSLYHPKRKDIQFHLVNQMLQRLKDIGIKLVTTEFSNNIREANDLFFSLGFSNPQVIFQSWEGLIQPIDHVDISPYDIRRVRKKDLDITYSWIAKQLDKFSPLYISKATYKELLRAPKSLKEGWAIAMLNNKPVAMVSSLIEARDKSLVIFGPYSEDGYENVRIPLLNELFLYFRLRGFTNARILRLKPFSNDKLLFKFYKFDKIEEIKLMSKNL